MDQDEIDKLRLILNFCYFIVKNNAKFRIIKVLLADKEPLTIKELAEALDAGEGYIRLLLKGLMQQQVIDRKLKPGPGITHQYFITEPALGVFKSLVRSDLNFENIAQAMHSSIFSR